MKYQGTDHGRITWRGPGENLTKYVSYMADSIVQGRDERVVFDEMSKLPPLTMQDLARLEAVLLGALKPPARELFLGDLMSGIPSWMEVHWPDPLFPLFPLPRKVGRVRGSMRARRCARMKA